MRPRVVSKVIDKDGRCVRSPGDASETPWNPENVEFVRKALAGVVNDYERAEGEAPGIVVAEDGHRPVASVKGKMIKSEDLPYEIATTPGSSRSRRWTTRRSSLRRWWSTGGTADPPPPDRQGGDAGILPHPARRPPRKEGA